MKTIGILGALTLILAGCSNEAETTSAPANAAEVAEASATSLSDVIAHERRDENRARDEWRHPQETLSFFGIEPDMTIVEVLPGNGGWYSQILNPLSRAHRICRYRCHWVARTDTTCR